MRIKYLESFSLSDQIFFVESLSVYINIDIDYGMIPLDLDHEINMNSSEMPETF